jgi:DNA-binding transcriptional MerR regulator
MAEDGRLRIGELSKRVGVSPELLRAWETRYGLVEPERTPGGLRLYSREDEARVRGMRDRIAAGLSAAEAARVTLGTPTRPVSVDLLVSELDRALTDLDEPAAQAALDEAFDSLDLETALGQVVLPFLRGLGERWSTAERSVGQEHFASNVIEGMLRTQARGWGNGDGPSALLACPPGEQHELGLICFGLLLGDRGWRITYFGAETPVADVATAVTELSPELAVLTAIDAQRFLDASEEIRALSARARLAIGGAGASLGLAKSLGVELLANDPVAAARAASGAASSGS